MVEIQQSEKEAPGQRQHGDREESPARCMKDPITTIKQYGKEFAKMLFVSIFEKGCLT